jgi:hypothetical protein
MNGQQPKPSSDHPPQQPDSAPDRVARPAQPKTPHQQSERQAISRFLRQHQYSFLRFVLYLVLGMFYIFCLSDRLQR